VSASDPASAGTLLEEQFRVLTSTPPTSIDLFDAPVLRVGTPDVRIPSAPSLQAALVPDEARNAEAVRGLARDRA
jgi:hypothetical protein